MGGDPHRITTHLVIPTRCKLDDYNRHQGFRTPVFVFVSQYRDFFFWELNSDLLPTFWPLPLQVALCVTGLSLSRPMLLACLHSCCSAVHIASEHWGPKMWWMISYPSQILACTFLLVTHDVAKLFIFKEFQDCDLWGIVMWIISFKRI